MKSFNELTPEIINRIMPEARLMPEDQAVIDKNHSFLASLTDDIVVAFYDAAFSHGPTEEVFEEGERPAREESLRDWWTTTISKPIDDDYFKWMTLVGVIHIRRKVKNPMMLSMLAYVTSFVGERALAELDKDTAIELIATFGRLQTMIGSLISDAYTESFIGSLESMAGLSPQLTERMLGLEITKLEAEGREALS